MAGYDARSPLAFIVLVFVLTVPFWAIGAVVPRELLPGLPLSALAAACPAVAAAILVWRAEGSSGVRALLARAFDFGRISAPVWYLVIFLLAPAIMATAYLAMRVLGWPLPAPAFDLPMFPVLFAAFFIFGLGEEIGWSGYAIDPMQKRWGALQAALMLGAIWAAWHVIALLQAGRAPTWIAWWTLGTVALRVLTVWIYNNTGRSVFAAALFHAMCNVSWQLFPNAGSAYDPRIVAPIEAAAAIIVALVWGARTLTRAARR